MKIIFTNHAKFKLKVFERHGLKITENNIKEILENPTAKSPGRKGRLIVQGPLDDTHVLRVICEAEDNNNIRVITFYPARRKRYEN